ncbi:hypothetical protein AAV94_13420 [Lampropedia cohaerens]|uniref:DUF883 domain-containing protein n=1 Tax=Lampropedia cohaerens TaxID=1610491 RepID=A0A0U1PW42_9BURK|nr:DUF883 family protein [Lampropedia cohaerens]KKW66758.1 hypothetical protein AAV94_13420 [Lampropedia cohaerens]
MGIFSGKSQPRDDFERLVNELRDVISSRDLDDVPQIRQLRQKFDDGVHSLQDLRESAVRTAQEAAARAREGADVANRYAHDEPWQVAGVALAAGALIGFLLARR